tara:strand:- start:160 stop:477 length:318 start_codon:yes stop_codon:yes gene_type:complete
MKGRNSMSIKNVQSSLSRETHNQYRNRVGRISRHQHLMSQNVIPSNRRKEIKRLEEATARVEKKLKKEIEELKVLEYRVNISKRLKSQVTDSRLHNERQVAEATA